MREGYKMSTECNVTFQCDGKFYPIKPDSYQASVISCNLINSQNTIHTSVASLVQSSQKYSIAPFEIKTLEGRKGLSQNHWKSQQVVFLDIDNKDVANNQRIQDEFYCSAHEFIAMAHKHDVPLISVSYTMSSSPDWERFRAIILLDKSIDNVPTMHLIYAGLKSIFIKADYCILDEKCTSLNRWFYRSSDSVVYQCDDDYPKVSTHELIQKGMEFISVSETKSIIKKKNSDVRLLPTEKVNNPSEPSYNQLGWGQDTQKILDLIKNGQSFELNSLFSDKGLNFSEFLLQPQSKNDILDISTEEGTLDIDFKKLYNVPSNINNPPKNVIIFNDLSSILESLMKIPINIFFNIENKTSCIIHSDRNPSASVKAFNNGNYRYFCFSDRCKLNNQNHSSVSSFSLIDLICSLQNSSIPAAIVFLSKVLDIHLVTKRQHFFKQNIVDIIEHLLV